MAANPVLALMAAVLATAGCDLGVQSRPGLEADAVAAAVAEPEPPPTVGLDSALLAAAERQGEEMPRLRTLLVARHGELELERHYRGPALTTPANVKSVSKSVLSAVVGIALAEGHLDDVHQPVAPFFRSHIPAVGDDPKARITVGNLLSMQSGLESTSGRNYGAWVTSGNWVRYAITRPMVAEPGTRRIYSTGNSHLLAAVLTQATGKSLWAYTREKLAEPLGITLPRWLADPQGIHFGGNEMRMTPRAMLAFGELYRNGGRHEGVQVVPEPWVQASLTPQTDARRRGEGYGYGWFTGSVRGHPMFYAWGYGGQFIFIVPDLELTVVTTSDPDVAREGEHIRAVRQLLETTIVPAAERGALPVQDGRVGVR
ncbi:MAG TPA: serine hydrolase [Longimicrobiales bacterium]|nr:serine hydrolase [Longimicrobiales bacterium]